MSIRQGNNIIASGRTKGYAPNILDFKWSDHIINDIQWLRSDTFSWQSGAVYQTAYQHLVSDINGITAETETIGDTTITFYRATDGHKIVLPDQEANVEAIFNATGVAWYFILDIENRQFKLPRTKFGFTGLRDSVGKYVEAGLPNIEGKTNSIFLTGGTKSAEGAFSSMEYTNSGSYFGGGTYVNSPNWNIISDGGEKYTQIKINASKSSSIYGNSTTVQPPATQMYLYFYVGEYAQTAIEQTAGITAEILNGKMDLDGNQAIIGIKTAPASDTIDSILTTVGISKAQNGYVKLGNGIIIQWGLTDDIPGSGALTVNLQTPFSSSNYSLSGGARSGNSTSGIMFSSLTTTSFNIDWGSATVTSKAYWIAIGY